MKQNWKTTTAGVLVILVGVINGVILPVLQGHPININEVVTTIPIGAGLIHASDSK